MALSLPPGLRVLVRAPEVPLPNARGPRVAPPDNPKVIGGTLGTGPADVPRVVGIRTTGARPDLPAGRSDGVTGHRRAVLRSVLPTSHAMTGPVTGHAVTGPVTGHAETGPVTGLTVTGPVTGHTMTGPVTGQLTGPVT